MALSEPLLILDGICKSFNHHLLLQQISLELDHGRILGLLGPSGCGKTTLLRIIAGLEQADAGKLIFDGRDISSTPPHKRQFRMMFQEFALFPHKNVYENIAFGLEIQSLSPKKKRKRTEEMLDLVGLARYGHRDIDQLSRGERQRVALARSLAPSPRLLLLDEPLGALDRALRKRLLLDLNRILRAVKVPTIVVTHDQNEAFALADKVAVIMGGRVEQIAEPEVLYHAPKNRSVAGFLGFQNIIPGIISGVSTIRTELGVFTADIRQFTEGQEVHLLIKPNTARIIDSDNHEDEVVISGEVTERLFQGINYHVNMVSETGQELAWDFSADREMPNVGESVRLAVPKSSATVLPD